MSKTLFDVIAEVESNNNLRAVRFEPATYAHLLVTQKLGNKAAILKQIQKIHACTLATAQTIYSTSYGCVQLMGFNLYFGQRYDKTVFDFCQSIDDQRLLFALFCGQVGLGYVTSDILAGDKNARQAFALKYNGSLDYVVPLEAALIRLGFTLKG